MLAWQEVRPRGPWVLIKEAPPPEFSPGGNIVLPGFLAAGREYSKGGANWTAREGVVLRKSAETDKLVGGLLLEGAKILFRDAVQAPSAREFAKHEDGCKVFLLNVGDLLAVIS